MRILILASVLVCTVNCFAEDKSNVAERAELHDVVVSYFEMQHRFGLRHPNMVKMRTEIQSRLNAGEQFIPGKLNTTLSALYREHRAMTEKLSMRHPRILANLERLSITSKLMTYSSDYFAKNWQRLSMSKP